MVHYEAKQVIYSNFKELPGVQVKHPDGFYGTIPGVGFHAVVWVEANVDQMMFGKFDAKRVTGELFNTLLGAFAFLESPVVKNGTFQDISVVTVR